MRSSEKTKCPSERQNKKGLRKAKQKEKVRRSNWQRERFFIGVAFPLFLSSAKTNYGKCFSYYLTFKLSLQYFLIKNHNSYQTYEIVLAISEHIIKTAPHFTSLLNHQFNLITLTNTSKKSIIIYTLVNKALLSSELTAIKFKIPPATVATPAKPLFMIPLFL